VCDYCGSKASDEANYCSQCGEVLEETDPTQIFHCVKACPYCNTMKAPEVLRSPRPFRILHCNDCGGNYKTIELIWIGEKTFSFAEKHKSFLKT